MGTNQPTSVVQLAPRTALGEAAAPAPKVAASLPARRRPWKLVLGGAVLLLAAGATYWFWPFRRNAHTLRLPGVVETQEVRLGSKVSGRVAEVFVREGDLIAPGQVLVRFDVPELKAQRAQQAARVKAAEAELLEAQNGPRPQEKQAARAAARAAKARLDRMLAGWRAEEKDMARGELASAEANLKLAREEYDRVERLYRQGSAGRAEYDAARAQLERTRGAEAAARAKVEMMTTGNRPEDIAEAKALLAQAEANADLLEAGTRPEDVAGAEARLAEAQARLAELDANLREAEIRAPEAAVVEVLAVRPGDVVPPNQPVLRVLRADDLWVKVYVPETELGKVRLGQTVEVYLDAYPGRPFAGAVQQIASESEFTPRNVQSPDERRHQVFGVKIRVEQPADPGERVFKSGLAAEVVLPLHE